MAKSKAILHLLFPSLFDLCRIAHDQNPDQALSMPALERLLSRGRETKIQAHGFTRSLLDLLGVDVGSTPLAALYRIGATGKQDKQWCMRADPVHLITNMTDVVLDDPRTLQLNIKESEQLLSTVQDHVLQDGWHCEMLSPQEWIVRLDNPRELIVDPVDSVIGRNVLNHLPCGEDGGYWRQVMNEIQMLLHDHPVNVVREERGLPEANGLWLWGGGQISPQDLSQWSHFFGDDALSMGLALNNGVPQSPCATYTDSRWHGEGNILWAMARPDEGALVDYLTELDRSLFKFVLGQLQAGQLHSVTLYPAPGARYDLHRMRLGTFWRKNISLLNHIKQLDTV